MSLSLITAVSPPIQHSWAHQYWPSYHSRQSTYPAFLGPPVLAFLSQQSVHLSSIPGPTSTGLPITAVSPPIQHSSAHQYWPLKKQLTASSHDYKECLQLVPVLFLVVSEHPYQYVSDTGQLRQVTGNTSKVGLQGSAGMFHLATDQRMGSKFAIPLKDAMPVSFDHNCLHHTF